MFITFIFTVYLIPLLTAMVNPGDSDLSDISSFDFDKFQVKVTNEATNRLSNHMVDLTQPSERGLTFFSDIVQKRYLLINPFDRISLLSREVSYNDFLSSPFLYLLDRIASLPQFQGIATTLRELINLFVNSLSFHNNYLELLSDNSSTPLLEGRKGGDELDVRSILTSKMDDEKEYAPPAVHQGGMGQNLPLPMHHGHYILHCEAGRYVIRVNPHNPPAPIRCGEYVYRGPTVGWVRDRFNNRFADLPNYQKRALLKEYAIRT